MATRDVVVADSHEPGTKTATWVGLSSGDDGKPVDVSRYASVSVQCTAGTIGTSTLQGSALAAGPWGAIGAGLTIAASNRVDVVPQGVKWVRPNVGAGGSGATVVVTMGQPSV